MPRHQPAYRRRHSTESALAFVFSELISALDGGNLAPMALFDLSAAFDCVDHDILFSRLTSHMASKIRSTARCHRTFQAVRVQSVRVDGASSRAETMQYGVPQGSLLGPLLFLLHNADLDAIVTKHGLMSHFYADDSLLFTVVRIRSNSCGSSPSSALWTLTHGWSRTGCDWIQQKQSFCDAQLRVDIIISTAIHSSLARPLSSLPPSQEISEWRWIRTSQWGPTSLNWFILVFIRFNRFDRFVDQSPSTPPGS